VEVQDMLHDEEVELGVIEGRGIAEAHLNIIDDVEEIEFVDIEVDEGVDEDVAV
jgi:hypothetical protein